MNSSVVIFNLHQTSTTVKESTDVRRLESSHHSCEAYLNKGCTFKRWWFMKNPTYIQPE
jgi:hypothetical protein